jgi:hypothetical protein
MKFISLFLIISIVFSHCICIPIPRIEHLVGTEEWNIDEYKIIRNEYSHHKSSLKYECFIYKNDKEIGDFDPYDNPYDPNKSSDSCHLIYGERSNYYINFNLCNKSKSILKDDKSFLDSHEIDSITLRQFDSVIIRPMSYIIYTNFDSTKSKRFNNKQIETFVTNWNNSTTLGYNLIGTSFEWLVVVYTKGEKREFKVIDNDITENGKWSYQVKDKDFFGNIWESD